MKTQNILEKIKYPKAGILSEEIFKDSKNNITLFCMSKGSEMGEHTSSKNAFIQVIEGQGIFNLNGKKIKMKPGTFIPMKKNAVHSLSAIKNTSFMLYLN